MVSALDIDSNKLNTQVVENLKKLKIEKPAFVEFVKSGAHTERAPEQEDFFYIRCASLLRQMYKKNTIGVRRLRIHYGGRKNRGVKPSKHTKAGGAIIRKAFQILEKAGLIEKVEKGLKKGRKLSPAGRKFLDNAAKQVNKG